MSMFSIASVSVTSCRATVRSKGYRFTQTRSIGSIPSDSSVAMCSGIVAHRQQGRVQPRMQRLHAAVQDLRRPGQLGDVAHLQVGLAQGGGGTPGGDDLHPQAAPARARNRRSRSCRRRRSGPGAPGSPPPRRWTPPFPAGRDRISHAYSRVSTSTCTSRGLSGSTPTAPAAIRRIASGSSLCSTRWISFSSWARSRVYGTSMAAAR